VRHCQKPLMHDVHESRQLRAAAAADALLRRKYRRGFEVENLSEGNARGRRIVSPLE